MKTVGIIGAMEEEISYLLPRMEVITKKKLLNLEFYIGRFVNLNVVVVSCGIGKVNAAVACSALINQFAADYVINIGVAGSLSDEVSINDIVISTEAVQHDFDATSFGLALGEIPRMDIYKFASDQTLFAVARESAKELTMEHKIHFGTIASGDQFVSDGESKKRIRSHFQALCVEMEGAAIAQTCYLNEIPFIIIRSISDRADQEATHDYDEFLAQAVVQTYQILEKMCTKLEHIG